VKLKQKESLSVITRTAGNPSAEVGKKLASIAVHGEERLQGNWLEGVLAFQCAVFGRLLLRVAAISATALAEPIAV